MNYGIENMNSQLEYACARYHRIFLMLAETSV